MQLHVYSPGPYIYTISTKKKPLKLKATTPTMNVIITSDDAPGKQAHKSTHTHTHTHTHTYMYGCISLCVCPLLAYEGKRILISSVTHSSLLLDVQIKSNIAIYHKQLTSNNNLPHLIQTISIFPSNSTTVFQGSYPSKSICCLGMPIFFNNNFWPNHKSL